ncbi:MAG: GNAT family N-acetyltransferase, partial [Bacteroidetes bacterium]|nr:GNAT family N-acetyltransferase [Bacteroidota bacterium]
GFYFPENIPKETAFDILEEALILVQNELEKSGLNIDGIFIKDIVTEHRAPMKVLVERKFREFTFHPNMVLNIRENWKTFDDYMAAISSKYRVRAKKAFRHIEAIEKRELTEHQIFSYQNRLFELYKSVAENQDFNMVSLDENYLPALKRQLGDRFRVFGYFLDGELVGYFTTIRNHEELEAHFLGFEPECNRQCQVYQNMLFDILRLGIEQGVKKVVYARTAMEIKSSVGAEPYEMLCYIRASNRLTNKILTPIIEYLRPAADWVPRNPFKN